MKLREVGNPYDFVRGEILGVGQREVGEPAEDEKVGYGEGSGVGEF